MRISTSYIQQQNIDSMLKRQSELSQTQMQVSTGKKILHASDDPISAVQTLSLQRGVNLSEQYISNSETAENKLSITEGILISVNDTLQRVRELAVQGLNDSYDVGSRQGIAEEIEQLNNILVNLASTTDSNGEYIFSGYQTDTAPFDGTFNYQGDNGQRHIRVGEGYSVPINEVGDIVFGDGATSIFQSIKDFAADLRLEPKGAAVVGGFLGSMDSAMDNANIAQVKIGTRMNAVDHQRAINESTKFSMETILSQVQDLDYAKAITQLNLQMTGLQAAQQSYAKVQNLSLFNYL